jgi:hypothetical protein
MHEGDEAITVEQFAGQSGPVVEALPQARGDLVPLPQRQLRI